MAYGEGPSAGDRYRIKVTSGSVVKNMFRSKKARAAWVSIVDARGDVVWKRSVETIRDAHSLVDLITTQVFSAPLEDFEHWLRTEGANG
jgi:hypothetical protein